MSQASVAQALAADFARVQRLVEDAAGTLAGRGGPGGLAASASGLAPVDALHAMETMNEAHMHAQLPALAAADEAAAAYLQRVLDSKVRARRHDPLRTVRAQAVRTQGPEQAWPALTGAC